MNAPNLVELGGVTNAPSERQIQSTHATPTGVAESPNAVHQSAELAAYLHQIRTDAEREEADRQAQEELTRLREPARFD